MTDDRTVDIDLFQEWYLAHPDDANEFMRKHTKEYRLKKLWSVGYRYLARNKDGQLYAYDGSPVKFENAGLWDVYNDLDSGLVHCSHYFPEVKWLDDEPTEISDLLLKFENGWRTKFMGVEF